jgi:hypothetical protein
MKISTFEAKCSDCKEIFAHPSLGDMSYGQVIFYSTDGKNQVLVSAFSEFATKLKPLVSSNKAGAFWKALALFADPIQGQPFSLGVRCSQCGSSNIEYWEGVKLGAIELADVSFSKALTLTEAEIGERIAQNGANA